MRTKIYFNLRHHNVFQFYKIKSINATNIANKSSIKFCIIITKVAKNNSGVVVVQDRIIT